MCKSFDPVVVQDWSQTVSKSVSNLKRNEASCRSGKTGERKGKGGGGRMLNAWVYNPCTVACKSFDLLIIKDWNQTVSKSISNSKRNEREERERGERAFNSTLFYTRAYK